MANLLNEKDGGVVTSNSFNLTRVTTVLAALIGGGTALSGAAADDEGNNIPDWASFNQGQRLVIIVAVIAAWAVVVSSDILGRSYATGQSGRHAPVVFGTIRAARVKNFGADLPASMEGSVVAVRGEFPAQFLWKPDAGGKSIWVPGTDLDFP